ncbi:hypothetical protein LEP1GSC073_1917 [Leptospira noguchii str. Cascata]|nr:hypothetical protein LEP1GSC072_4140 [Leptospira noguchii str. Bonito]EMS89229.1 hypothetical protein LEP1GSC073_1917 [Leptospira noguchii str. Cascata]
METSKGFSFISFEAFGQVLKFYSFQSLTVNPRFVRVPTFLELGCKSTICESSHIFRV